MPIPAIMEIVIEVFNNDHLTHSWNFGMPHLMSCLWNKNLRKDVDNLFTEQAGGGFLDKAHCEPLIAAVVVTLVHFDRHQGSWLAREMTETRGALFRDSDSLLTRKTTLLKTAPVEAVAPVYPRLVFLHLCGHMVWENKPVPPNQHCSFQPAAQLCHSYGPR